MPTDRIVLRSAGTLLLAMAAISGCSNVSDSRGPATPDAANLFDGLQKLQGRWESPDADNDGKPDAAVVYRVTSNGSAIEETLLPGTPHEMVTLYNMDHGRLVLTHYCALGNQPRLEAAPESTAGKIVFRFVDGMNLDARKDQYMGALTMTIDGDRLKQEWTSFKDGKAEAPHVFEYARVKG